jgi:hypothetical protein
MLPTLLALTFLATWISPASGDAGGKSAPTRVYIYTDRSPGGIATEEEQGRVDTVDDLRNALRRNRKLALVTDRDDAQVVVEVLDREKRDKPIGGFGGTSITPSGETVVRLRVTFGGEQTEIKGIAPGYWGRAAKDAAERLTKWIERMSSRLSAPTKVSPPAPAGGLR